MKTQRAKPCASAQRAESPTLGVRVHEDQSIASYCKIVDGVDLIVGFTYLDRDQAVKE
jgi:hypothetical protein